MGEFFWLRKYGWLGDHDPHDDHDPHEKHEHDALQESNKVLVVIFIIALFISSIGLLCKILHHQNRVFNVRKSMVSVLTLGILLITMYPLVLSARAYFEHFYRLGCKPAQLAHAYESFFFPFVYGIGMVTMAIELLFSSRRSTTHDSPGVTTQLILVAFPWLLALLVLLPLILDGFDFGTCGYLGDAYSRYRELFWIGMIVPAVLVLLFAVVLMCQVKSTPTTLIVEESASPSAPSEPTERSNINVGYVHYTEPKPPSPTGAYPHAPPAYSEFDHQNNRSVQPEVPEFQQDQIASNISLTGFQHADNVLYPTLPEHSVYSQRTNTATFSLVNNLRSYRRDFKKEANAFVWPAVTFFLGSIPIALYNLLNMPFPLQEQGIDTTWYKIVYWISLGRWFAINILWIVFWSQ